MSVASVARIEEPRWAWHIGLDAESTSILNDLWSGIEVEHRRMRRVLALFRMEFANAGDMRPDIAGRAVVLALSSARGRVVRMKPQNLLVNLPLAQALMTPDYWVPKAKRVLARGDAVLGGHHPRVPEIALARRGEPFQDACAFHRRPADFGEGGAVVWNRRSRLAPGSDARADAQGRAAGPARLRPVAAQGRVHRRPRAPLCRRARIACARLAGHGRRGGDRRTGQVRGIGRWTAEMFLIFNLLRPDVLPLDDLGLQKAIGWHYFRGRSVTVASACANWAQPGRRGVRSPPGTCGAASTRCRSNTETPRQRLRQHPGSALEYGLIRIGRSPSH